MREHERRKTAAKEKAGEDPEESSLTVFKNHSHMLKGRYSLRIDSSSLTLQPEELG